MTIIEVIKNVIQSKHGWAVAEHFQCTIENVELFDEQDKNALKYINDTITKILKNNSLDDMAEIRQYHASLSDYLNKH